MLAVNKMTQIFSFILFYYMENKIIFIFLVSNLFMYSYSQKYFAFLKNINFKEKMLREGIILKYFSYILINLTRGTQK